MKITATVITLNEESSIARALNSLQWADEIIVVDSGSSDSTITIAREMGATVLHRDWTGFADQKQFAAQRSTNDWIFSLDADEVVSDELQVEILKLKAANHRADGYRMPRLAFYMDRAIRHSGWYPDRQLRLYDRKKGQWKRVPVHESVELIDGAKLGVLNGEIHHYSVKNAAYHHKMIGERYAPLAAEAMYSKGRRANALTILTAAPIAFLRSYVVKLGFLDGIPGMAIAAFAAHHAFLKQLLLHEMQRNQPHG